MNEVLCDPDVKLSLWLLCVCVSYFLVKWMRIIEERFR